MATRERYGIDVIVDSNELDVTASPSNSLDWSLGCDITIEDIDSTIKEIRVEDICLSAEVATEELAVEINKDLESSIELGVNVALGGFNVTGVGKVENIYNYLGFGKEYSSNSVTDTFNAHAINSLYLGIKEAEQDIRNAESAIGTLESEVELLKQLGGGSGSDGNIGEEALSAIMNAISAKADKTELSKYLLLTAPSQKITGDIEIDGSLIVRGDMASAGEGDPNTQVGLNEEQLQAYLDLHKYVTENDVKNLIPEVNLSNYYTKQEVDTKISTVSGSVNGIVSSMIGDKADRSELSKYLLLEASNQTIKGDITIDGNLVVKGDMASMGVSENTGAGGSSTLEGLMDVALGSLNNGDLLSWNGSAWINIKQSAIVPNLTDYATKGYVSNALVPYATKDNVTSALGGYLPLSGGTISGNLLIGAENNTAYNYIRIWRNNKNIELASAGDIAVLSFNGVGFAFNETQALWHGNTLIHSGNIGNVTPIRNRRTESIDLNTAANGFYEIGYSGQTLTNSPTAVNALFMDFRDASGLAKAQFVAENHSRNLYFRAYQSGTASITSAWRTIIHDNNIGDYALLKEATHQTIKGNLTVEGSLIVKGDMASGGTGGSTTGGSSSLENLTDVLLGSLNNGDILSWNGSKWVNIRQSSIVPDLSGYATQGYVTSALSGYLPKSGGTISGSLQIGEDSNTAYNYLKLVRSGHSLALNCNPYGGYITYNDGVNNSVFRLQNGGATLNDNTILHSGNIGDYKAGDSDKLGGQSASLYVYTKTITEDINDIELYGTRSFVISLSSSAVNVPTAVNSGDGIYIAGYDTGFMILSSYSQDKLLYRRGMNKLAGGSIVTNDWKTIAFTDSNVASADYASNAGTLGGYRANYGKNKPWGTIPVITETGYMDVGRHFEFHYDNTTGSDYSTVLMCTGNYSNIVHLPSTSGTLALTTDTVAAANRIITTDKRIVVESSVDDKYVDFGGYTSTAGYDAYISGKNIYLRYGTSLAKGLILNSSANVTIGSSDLAGTTAKLYVDGHIKLGSTGYLYKGDKSVIDFNGEAPLFGYGTAKAGLETNVYGNVVRLYYGGVSNVGLTLNSSGNVLVGTESDNGDRLQVSGNIYASQKLKTSGILELSSLEPIHFTSIGSGTYDITAIYHKSNGIVIDRARTEDSSSASVLPIIISQRGGGVAAKFFGDNLYVKGNVLIGTETDNGAKLQVNGNIRLAAGKDCSIGSPYETSDVTAYNNITFGSHSTGLKYYSGSWTGSNVVAHEFIVNSGSALAIMNNGNVGIGTTSPSAKLHVIGDSRAEGNFDIKTPQGGSICIFSITGNSTALKAFAYGDTSYIESGNSAYGSNMNLHIRGISGKTGANLTFSYSTSQFNGNVIVTGDLASGSDIRFKDIINNTSLDINDIANAPLFTFKWNDREDDKTHIGTSAQYWESICKELVTGEEFKTLNYASLGVAMGISLAKKTLNHEERIKELEKRISELETENRRLQYGS